MSENQLMTRSIIVLLLIIFGIGFIAYQAQAFDNQTIRNSTSTVADNYIQYIGEGGDFVKNVHFNFNPGTGGGTWAATLYGHDTATSTFDLSSTNCNSFGALKTNISIATGTNDGIDIDASYDLNLQTTSTFVYRFFLTGQAGNDYMYGMTSPTSSPNDWFLSPTGCSPIGSMTAMYFEFENENFIEFTNPVDGHTTSTNFGLWQGRYNIGNDVNFLYIDILYGDESSDSNYAADWDFHDTVPTPFSIGDHNFVVSRLNDLSSTTTYYAKAVLSNNFDIFATSSIITFGISDASSALVFPVVDYDPDYARSILATKFPFAYFYDIADLYSGFALSPSSSLPSLSIDTTSSSLAMNFEILSPGTATTFVSASTFYTLRALLMASLWLGFAYYLFDRIRILQL